MPPASRAMSSTTIVMVRAEIGRRLRRVATSAGELLRSRPFSHLWQPAPRWTRSPQTGQRSRVTRDDSIGCLSLSPTVSRLDPRTSPVATSQSRYLSVFTSTYGAKGMSSPSHGSWVSGGFALSCSSPGQNPLRERPSAVSHASRVAALALLRLGVNPKRPQVRTGGIVNHDAL